MTIYLDLAVLINFLVDYFLLIGTNRLSGFPMEPVRSAFAAMVGGVYGGASVLGGFRFLSGLFWRLAFLFLISFAAFGFRYSSLRRSAIFIILSLSLSGAAIVLGSVSFPGIILCGFFLLLLTAVAFGTTIGSRTYLPLQLCFEDRTASVVALCDSGNTLRDPVTGEQVVVLDGKTASSLTGLTLAQISSPMDTLAQGPIPGLRLIPFHSVGCDGGMLLAMRFEGVKIGTTVRSAVIAFSPHGLGGDYQALVSCDAF